MARQSATLLFFGFLLLYLLTMGGHLYSPDEEVLFRTTESIAERAELAIEPIEQGFATQRGLNGKEYAQYGIGQPILAVPFYYLGAAFARWFDGPPPNPSLQLTDLAPDAQWKRFGVSLFNQFTAALLVALLFSLAHHLTGDRRAALLTAILYGAGTMAWVHSKPFFTETLATLLIFSCYALLVHARLYGQMWLYTVGGVIAGYALLTRLDSLFAFPGLAVLLLWPEPPAISEANEPLPPEQGERRRGFLDRILEGGAWDRVSRFAPPVALACLIVVLFNWTRFNSLTATGYEDQPEGIAFINPILVGLYGLLLSVGRGLFLFSPPLILFFFAIRRFVNAWPAAGWSLVTILLGVLLVHAKWINWAGGWCWGPRHVFMLHVFLALPIAVLLMAPRGMAVRISYAALLAVGIMVQIYGTSQNFIDYYRVAFTVPFLPPNATAVYNPGEDYPVMQFYEVYRQETPFWPRRRIHPSRMLAPITDSIWRFQNSAWYKYREMWDRGYHDYFWLELAGEKSHAAEAKRMIESFYKSAAETKRPARVIEEEAP